jgi:hypothetical protein
VTLAGSKIDSFNFIFVKNLKTCIAVHSYINYNMSKAQSLQVKNGLDASQNKAVNLAEYVVTSAHIFG